jgi:hypothetical protein
MKTFHPQIMVKLKRGSTKIDAGIRPLILWMDSFKFIRTIASCQGYCSYSPLPYVFFSAQYNDLIKMLKALPVLYYDDKIRVSVGYNSVIPKRPPALYYTLEFLDKKRFHKTIEKLEKELDK